MVSLRAGFTLLEICLALMIGGVLLSLAIPSISGLLAEQRLRRSFTHFDELVGAAHQYSLTNQRTCLLRRNGQALEVVPVGPASDPVVTWILEKDERIDLQFPAALQSSKTPAPEAWLFWKSGQCEPARVSYQGPAGHWEVAYHALTSRSELLDSNTR